MFENPRRGRQARHFTTIVPKILDLKSSSEQIFSEICRWVSPKRGFMELYLPKITEKSSAISKVKQNKAHDKFVSWKIKN